MDNKPQAASTADLPFTNQCPNIAFWIKEQGWIELGYDPNTATCARAGDEGGVTWSGCRRSQTPDEWMEALENGVGECIEELGLR